MGKFLGWFTSMLSNFELTNCVEIFFDIKTHVLKEAFSCSQSVIKDIFSVKGFRCYG